MQKSKVTYEIWIGDNKNGFDHVAGEYSTASKAKAMLLIKMKRFQKKLVSHGDQSIVQGTVMKVRYELIVKEWCVISEEVVESRNI